MSEEFDLIQTLGEGAFGKVYLVNAKKGGGQVCKILFLTCLSVIVLYQKCSGPTTTCYRFFLMV